MKRAALDLLLIVTAILAVARCSVANQSADAALAIGREKQRVSDSLRVRVAEAETRVVYRTDTVRLLATRYQTLRDSLVITDTVRVKEALATADTTIRACTELANDCAEYRKSSKELIWSMQREIDWWKKHDRPSEHRFGFGIGYGGQFQRDGTVTHGVTVGLSYRIWP